MGAAGAGQAGGDLTRVAAGASHDAPSHPGRITIKDRVLVRIAEEATADTLRIGRGDVSAGVSQAQGGIALTIRTPLPIPHLDDTAAIAAAVPVLEQVQNAQAQLKDRVAQLTGRDVTRVNITVTGAVIAQQKRVK
ncbi:hypothetical protein QL996_07205 [Planococcus sp. APC 4015]|nr:hypothetical protein [Planococcus sp. APC 4015]